MAKTKGQTLDLKLTAEERAAVMPSLQKLQALQKEMQATIGTIQPFVKMIAEKHGVNLEEYNLLPDGTAFVKRG